MIKLSRCSPFSASLLLDIFLHLRSETWTQWTIEAARVKVHHRPYAFEDGPVVYPANASDKISKKVPFRHFRSLISQLLDKGLILGFI